MSTVYYKTSVHCPRVDAEGKPVLYKVMFDNEPVWIMHQGLVPDVRLLAQREGVRLVEFDIDAFVRKQCVKTSLGFLDSAMDELRRVAV